MNGLVNVFLLYRDAPWRVYGVPLWRDRPTRRAGGRIGGLIGALDARYPNILLCSSKAVDDEPPPALASILSFPSGEMKPVLVVEVLLALLFTILVTEGEEAASETKLVA